MSVARVTRFFVPLFAALVGSLPVTASACAVCMGDPSTKTAGAINGAIFLMLGFVGLMLTAVGVFAYSLMKRAHRPVPPHVELAAMMSAQEVAK